MSDDLVKKLRSQIGDDVQEVYDRDALFRLAADRIEALERKKREAVLDALAALGQAHDAYEAQLKAEAKLAEVEKERDDAVKEAGIQMRHLQVLADSLAAAEAALATARADALREAAALIKPSLGPSGYGVVIAALHREADRILALLTEKPHDRA